MKKIIVLTFVSLDGVMQAPGGPDEDPSGGFRYGGWVVNYFDEFLGKVMDRQMGRPYDLLLGRKTYEIFAGYWPHANPVDQPLATGLNNARKYVASRTLEKLEWKNSVLIRGDLPEEIKKLKMQDGPDIQGHGSGNLFRHFSSMT